MKVRGLFAWLINSFLATVYFLAQDNKLFHAWRRSIWSKGIAVCFILMTVLGNIWFVMAFESQVPPLWLQWSFVLSLVFLGFFSFGLLLRQIILRFGKRDDNEPPV